MKNTAEPIALGNAVTSVDGSRLLVEFNEDGEWFAYSRQIITHTHKLNIK